MISVYFHGNCYDGMGAFWSAKRFMEQNNYDAEFKTAVYGGSFGFPKDKLVVFIDYCPTLEQLKELEKDNLVVILDHHDTAERHLVGVPKLEIPFNEVYSKHEAGEKGTYCLFDMNQSGAGIAYRYFFQTDVIPNMIKLIEDRDTWKFKYKETKDFHSYLLSKPFDYDVYTKIFEDSSDLKIFKEIIKKGEALTEYSVEVVKKICDLATFRMINGYKCGFVNTTSHWAEVGEYMVEHLGADYSVAFTLDFKLGLIKGSIRRPKGLNCTPLAEHFGGGGHPGAAGFSAAMSRSIEQLTNDIEDYINKEKQR